jgi:hypothetical protein
MQIPGGPGLIGAWTLLILLAWLLVRERGVKDNELCMPCLVVSLSLLITWGIGTLVLLVDATGTVYLHVLLEGVNVLVFVPVILMLLDLGWQHRGIRVKRLRAC